MNPLGFVIIGLGIIFIIIGVKGSQHNIISALTGHGGKASTTATTTQTGQQQQPQPQAQLA